LTEKNKTKNKQKQMKDDKMACFHEFIMV